MKFVKTAATFVMGLSLFSGAVFACGHAQDHAAHAHHGHHGHHAHGLHLFHGLELSETQQQEMKQAFEGYRQAKVELMQAKQQGEVAEMEAVIYAPVFDEVAAQQLIERKQQAKAAEQLKFLELKNKLYNVLTPEQQVQLKENIRYLTH